MKISFQCHTLQQEAIDIWHGRGNIVIVDHLSHIDLNTTRYIGDGHIVVSAFKWVFRIVTNFFH